jgi:hypothetical protein
MTTGFQQAYEQIATSVVGLGFRDDPSHTIIGTGFFIHETGWIMTNRHVIEGLHTQAPNGETVLHPNAAAYLFPTERVTKSKHGLEFFAAFGVTSLISAAWEPHKETEPETISKEQRDDGVVEEVQALHSHGADIGICQFNPEEVISQIPLPKPARVVSSDAVREGTPVGILGFPDGLNIPIEYTSRSQLQLTPILQTGVISARLPSGGFPNPDTFVLDIPVNQGSSGSPLFLENGDVVGIVYATRQYLSPLMEFNEAEESYEPSGSKGTYIPQSLGLAVPSERFPKEWLSEPE